MTETGVEARLGCPRWMKLALIVSLMLNVAVVGIIAGHNMKDERAKGAGNRQVQWILELVPDDRRDFAKAHFRDVRTRLQDIRAQRQEHLGQIIAAMRIEPFEPERFGAVLAERRNASLASRAIVHERLEALLGEFTPAERAIFAERLEARVSKWREHRTN